VPRSYLAANRPTWRVHDSESCNGYRVVVVVLGRPSAAAAVRSAHRTSRVVAGSNPDEVIDFFVSLPNPSSSILALGLIHPLA
jgi:hypothetical protein